MLDAYGRYVDPIYSEQYVPSGSQPVSQTYDDAYGYVPSGSSYGTPTTTTTTTQEPAPVDSGPSEEELRRQEIDSVFNPIFDYLGGLQSSAEGQYPSIQSDIQSQFGASKQSLDTEKQAGERTITESGVQADKRKVDALNSARNLYNELMMGGQQRFGGATSAGEAFRTLGAREFQRNQGKIQSGYEDTQRQIVIARTNLQERYQSAIANLEAQKNQALNEARRAFEDRIQEINRLKAQAESDKAAMRLEALQNLRNQVSGINSNVAGMTSALQAQTQAAASELAQAGQGIQQNVAGAQTATQNLMNTTTTNPQTNLAVGPSGGPVAAAPYLTGRIEDEKLFGNISPSREDIDSFYNIG